MKYIILFSMIFIVAITPCSSHAFGLLKWLGDAASNQLGLDRGPIAKATPKVRPPINPKYVDRIPEHAYYPVFHLQAEGF